MGPSAWNIYPTVSPSTASHRYRFRSVSFTHVSFTHNKSTWSLSLNAWVQNRSSVRVSLSHPSFYPDSPGPQTDSTQAFLAPYYPEARPPIVDSGVGPRRRGPSGPTGSRGRGGPPTRCRPCHPAGA